jgi:proline dehydrogenase
MSLLDQLIAASLAVIPKPVVGIVAKHYIAGETMEEALDVASDLEDRGFLTSVDVLGEDPTRIEQARGAAELYGRLVDEIEKRSLSANVSIKPTLFGLKINKQECRDLIRWLLERAHTHRNFVRVEMEDSTCTTDTIDVYRSLSKGFDNVGIVIQAYLRRSNDDIAAMKDIHPNVRIVKGVYVEELDIAYKDPRIINESYMFLAETLLASGSYVAFATHDEPLVREAFRLVERLGLPASAYEFQMLLGVEEELRNMILDAGHRIRVYIPFGRDWHPYSVRRLRENPAIARHVMRAMLKRG